jgi:hypothetical protein
VSGLAIGAWLGVTVMVMVPVLKSLLLSVAM